MGIIPGQLDIFTKVQNEILEIDDIKEYLNKSQAWCITNLIGLVDIKRVEAKKKDNKGYHIYVFTNYMNAYISLEGIAIRDRRDMKVTDENVKKVIGKGYRTIWEVWKN